MKYTFNKIVKGSFDEVKGNVIEALKAEKFGIITEINMSGTVKNKLDIDMPRYEILGACSPKHAYDSVMADEDMGAFLPCNISLSEKENGEVKVSVVNPVPYLAAVENTEVKEIVSEIAEAMKRVSDSL
jgi:uncharacterized protein (DUF302 family)